VGTVYLYEWEFAAHQLLLGLVVLHFQQTITLSSKVEIKNVVENDFNSLKTWQIEKKLYSITETIV